MAEGARTMRGYDDALAIRERKEQEGKDVLRTKKRRFILSDSESDERPERGKGGFVGGSGSRVGLKGRVVAAGGVLVGDRTHGGGNRDVGVGLKRKAYDAREDFRRVIGAGEEVSVKRMREGVLKLKVRKEEAGDVGRAPETSSCLRGRELGKRSVMHAAAERRRPVEQPAPKTGRLHWDGPSGAVVIRERDAFGAPSGGRVVRVQGSGGLLRSLPSGKKVGGVNLKIKAEGGRIGVEPLGGIGKSDPPGVGGRSTIKEAVSGPSHALRKQNSSIGEKDGRSAMTGLPGSLICKRSSLPEKNAGKDRAAFFASVVNKHNYCHSESRHHGRSAPSHKVHKSRASNKPPKKVNVNASVIDRQEGRVAGERTNSRGIFLQGECHVAGEGCVARAGTPFHGSGPSYETGNDGRCPKKQTDDNFDEEHRDSVEKNAVKDHVTSCINARIESEGSFTGEIKVHDRAGLAHKAKDLTYQDKVPSDVVSKDDLSSGEGKNSKIDLAGVSFASGDRKPQSECKSYTRRKKRINPVIADEKVGATAPDKKEEAGESTVQFVKAEDISISKSPKSACKNSRLKKTDRCTEKQKLREQIKNVLLEAGWKIDLRPRRGRDYKDSVYISPQGTGYWSITKAYAVYMEQLKDSSEADISNIEDTSGKISNMLKLKSEKAQLATIPFENISILKRIVVNKKKIKENTQKNDTMVESLSKRQVTETPTREGLSLLGKKRKNRRRCPLLARSSLHDLDSGPDEYIPYDGKRTVLSWMIDSGILPVKGKIEYMNTNRTQTMLEGWVMSDGIHCSCCSKILSVPKFEVHAGSKLGQPYENIFVQHSGFSLLQCLLSAWEKHEEYKKCGFYLVQSNGDDPNDDTCGLCGDGGDLICCDSCPSTFHLSCLEYEALPSGDWHCSNCSCKFCGEVDHGDAHRSSCSSELFQCKHCLEKYHQGCLCEEKAAFDEPNCLNSSFCGSSCKKIFEQLQKLLGVKNQLEADFSWSVVRRIGIDPQESLGTVRRAECNSKVAVAVEVMDECFLPLIDHRSGVNLIHNIVYNTGSNFNRLDFSGFYTFILERGDEMVAAASVRIHGTRIAEMPFIGTRIMYRRQGMCRMLLNAIELVLFSLNVQRLSIPAISELVQTWITVFDFKPMEGSFQKDIKSINMLVFPGTGLLVKTLVKQKDEPFFEVNRVVEVEKYRHQAPVVAKGTHPYCVTRDGHATETGMHPLPSTNAKSGSVDNAPEILQSNPGPFSIDRTVVRNMDDVHSSTESLVNLHYHGVSESKEVFQNAAVSNHMFLPGPDPHISDISGMIKVNLSNSGKLSNNKMVPLITSIGKEEKASTVLEFENNSVLSEARRTKQSSNPDVPVPSTHANFASVENAPDLLQLNPEPFLVDKTEVRNKDDVDYSFESFVGLPYHCVSESKEVLENAAGNNRMLLPCLGRCISDISGMIEVNLSDSGEFPKNEVLPFITSVGKEEKASTVLEVVNNSVSSEVTRTSSGAEDKDVMPDTGGIAEYPRSYNTSKQSSNTYVPAPSTHANPESVENSPEMLQSNAEPFFVDKTAVRNNDDVDSASESFVGLPFYCVSEIKEVLENAAGNDRILLPGLGQCISDISEMTEVNLSDSGEFPNDGMVPFIISVGKEEKASIVLEVQNHSASSEVTRSSSGVEDKDSMPNSGGISEYPGRGNTSRQPSIPDVPILSTHANAGSVENALKMLQSNPEPFFVDKTAVRNQDDVDSSTESFVGLSSLYVSEGKEVLENSTEEKAFTDLEVENNSALPGVTGPSGVEDKDDMPVSGGIAENPGRWNTSKQSPDPYVLANRALLANQFW